MRTILIAAAAAATAGLALAPSVAAQPANEWEIGPVTRGSNKSIGMPPRPAPLGQGWFFEFPYPSEAAGHVHYVTFPHGSLAGKSRITVRYRVEAAPGVRFVARDTPALPATVSLYFQRRGDSWSGRGRYAFYRWFAPPGGVRQIAPGVQEMTVSLQDPRWLSVSGGRNAGAHPRQFSEAIDQAGRVGLLFGSSARRGHGVFATGPARFTLLSFRVS